MFLCSECAKSLLVFSLWLSLVSAFIFHPQAIKTCCQDLFFARAAKSCTRATVPGHSVAMSSSLDSVFPQTHTLGQKLNVVNELVNTRVTAPTNLDYSDEVSIATQLCPTSSTELRMPSSSCRALQSVCQLMHPTLTRVQHRKWSRQEKAFFRQLPQTTW